MSLFNNKSLSLIRWSSDESNPLHFGLKIESWQDATLALPLGEKTIVEVKEGDIIPVKDIEDLHELARDWMENLRPDDVCSLDEFLCEDLNLSAQEIIEGYVILAAFDHI